MKMVFSMVFFNQSFFSLFLLTDWQIVQDNWMYWILQCIWICIMYGLALGFYTPNWYQPNMLFSSSLKTLEWVPICLWFKRYLVIFVENGLKFKGTQGKPCMMGELLLHLLMVSYFSYKLHFLIPAVDIVMLHLAFEHDISSYWIIIKFPSMFFRYRAKIPFSLQCFSQFMCITWTRCLPPCHVRD